MSDLGMDFDDEGWLGLLGGYRVPYDPRGALRSLEEGNDMENVWRELWNDLHHQSCFRRSPFRWERHIGVVRVRHGLKSKIQKMVDCGRSLPSGVHFITIFALPKKIGRERVCHARQRSPLSPGCDCIA